ncbi:restriction endonuclease subunit S [Streptosporangium canum]|uniref:restriction endonuclease subunit S n=1 Tax=Streptosporangium canum TaxID=324952 RepID=UPI0033BE58A9
MLINSTGTGTLGRVGFFESAPDERPCMADGHVTVVRLNEEVVDARFAYYWLGSQPFQDLIYAALVVGATNQIELNGERLASAPVPVPPLKEQRRIANMLDIEGNKARKLLLIRKHQLALTRERLAADTERLLLGISFEGSGAKRSSAYLCDLVPRHWRVGKLKHVARRVDVGIAEAATHAYASDGVPLLRSTNIRANWLRDDDLLYIEPWFAIRNKSKTIHGGDILTVRTGNAGVSAVVPEKFSGAQTFTQLITTIAMGHSPEYFCYYLNSAFCSAYFGQTSWGTAQKNISVPILADAPVPIPPSHEQAEISQRLTKSRKESTDLMVHLDNQIAMFDERMEALIAAAVTGQIDVTTARGIEG